MSSEEKQPKGYEYAEVVFGMFLDEVSSCCPSLESHRGFTPMKLPLVGEWYFRAKDAPDAELLSRWRAMAAEIEENLEGQGIPTVRRFQNIYLDGAPFCSMIYDGQETLCDAMGRVLRSTFAGALILIQPRPVDLSGE